MTQCRMCSQRMTRPGKLCRECERELQRARYAGVSLGEIEPVLAAEPSRMVAGDWLARLRSPGSMIALAFAVGVAATVALHVVDNSEAAVTHGSVMLDARQLSGLRQVSIVSASAAADDSSPQAATVVPPMLTRASIPISVRAATSTSTHARVRTPAPVVAQAEASEAPRIAMHQAPPHAASATLDPERALGDALARCGDEPFLGRPSCEQRARARYCDSAAPLAQCAVPVRDYGQ
jgi:hypothetical protein